MKKGSKKRGKVTPDTADKKSRELLIEVAYEVCNQVGGIYTVIRSKAPSVVAERHENYCLLGPYRGDEVHAEFEELTDLDHPFAQVVARMRSLGFSLHYGQWLVTGRPKVVLFELEHHFHALDGIKDELWRDHYIPTPNDDHLVNSVLVFGEMVRIFFRELASLAAADYKLIGHFHEWMGGSAICSIRREQLPVSTVFTTHATVLGRYLAMNDLNFYGNLPFYNWEQEANSFNIDTIVRLERACAHGCHVFTTVSDVTSKECIHLLGRFPDLVLPNGLNIERFQVLHEFQNLHQRYKRRIHQFVMGHFFQSYSFDLDETIYMVISGRHEYKNKGFDLMLEALARLNYRLQMQGEKNKKTVVAFIVTKSPVSSINPSVLQTRAVLDEIRKTCRQLERQVGDALFYNSAANSDYRLPDLNKFVDEHSRLRLRRTIQSWKSSQLPLVVTHNLENDHNDQILSFIRSTNLVNNVHDPVKVVYHPDFISTSSPLFGMEYGQFIRGCHLGIFPSYYEPWGYTPLECIASGIPTVTSDLAGFGNYAAGNFEELAQKGIYVVERRYKDYEYSANQLANYLFDFVSLNRRERVTLRNRTENFSVNFDWKELVKHYREAYRMGVERG